MVVCSAATTCTLLSHSFDVLSHAHKSGIMMLVSHEVTTITKAITAQ